MSRRGWSVAAAVLLPLVLAAVAVGGVLFLRQGGFAPYRVPRDSHRTVASDAATLARGEYLAHLGNCVACHTTRGGVPFAGGRAFALGVGTLYSTNLTPDARAGIGDWSADEFAHAMRNGVSRDGVLYPAFPYQHFAGLADADLDALYAYLRSLPPNPQKPPENRLAFPASSRLALVGWRMLYERPPGAAPATAPSAPDARGRYLVDALGHCGMCHSTRGPNGSLPAEGYLAGGRIPGLDWYAPPLDSRQLERYSVAELAAYLRDGTSPHGSAYGPMAEVVYAGLRAISLDDATAIAGYLKSLPPRPEPAPAAAGAEAAPRDAPLANGAEIYRTYCVDCHGDDGQGKPDAYPPLRGAVAVTAPDPVDALRIVLYGGMPVTTAGNPRPHTMPPFVQTLSAGEIAAVVNWIREGWGGRRSELGRADVEAVHGIATD
ncbi:MAG TPA: cytochrome c [Dokdonella sp.]